MNDFLKFGKALSKKTMMAITGKSGNGNCWVECNCAGRCIQTELGSGTLEQACASLCALFGGWNGVCSVGQGC